MSKLLLAAAIAAVAWIMLTAKPAIPQQARISFADKLVQLMEAGEIRQPRRWTQIRGDSVVIVFE